MSLQNSHQISDVKVMLVKGADGKGISNIEKTGSEGLTDIYTITYSDGTKSTFTVTNGASGGMSAEIYIVSEEGSEVSVTAPSGRTLVVEQVIGQPTLWRCLTTEFGVHTIESDLSGDISQVSLNVDVCKVYTVDDSHMHADIIATYPEGATCSCGKSGETPVYATENPYTFTVHSTGTYDITIVADGQTYTDSVTVTESGQEFVVPAGSTVTPTDDVQMLLACAGVIDENITTLSDLLADSTTLSAVIASHNAIDYLVRSTTFASDVTADSSAMSYIGLNNYASNTLLADSTWCSAIWASAYKESVFNVKVPIMTSNTTPSGVCACSQRESATYDAYKAFDGDNTTRWSSASENPSNRSLSYTFPNSVKIYGFEMLPFYKNNNVYIKDFEIVDDNGSVLYSGTVPNTSGIYNDLFVSPAVSAKYQLNTTSTNYAGNYDIEIFTVQFYGRVDV